MNDLCVCLTSCADKKHGSTASDPKRVTSVVYICLKVGAVPKAGPTELQRIWAQWKLIKAKPKDGVCLAGVC